MLIINITKVPLLLATLLLAGCSTTSSIYSNTGAVAIVASCPNSSWLDCYEVAGEKCKSAGYEVLEKITSRNMGFWSTGEIKQMIFVCNTAKQENKN